MATISGAEYDEQGSTPATPSSGSWKLYPKSDGFYTLDDAGTEAGPLGAGTGGPGGGATVITVRTNLTDKTSVAATSTLEQWGTEEATLAQADAPANATVVARVVGFAENLDGALRDGDYRVQISLDGGVTWSGGRTGYFREDSNRAHEVMQEHAAMGAVTGDIQARAQVRYYINTSGPDFKNGQIIMTVKPQHAADAV